MKILKYIFLLLLLTAIASSIFIATQKSNFSISKTTIINSKKAVVFNYVNDYKNWENWYVWEKDNSAIKIRYAKKTSGVGSSYFWSGTDGVGKTITIFVKENDSISQKTYFNNAISESSWTFKDTIGKTKVTFTNKGEMPFMFKIYAFLNGGIEKILGDRIEKSLVNLDKSLDYELNTFSIKPNGIVIKKGGFYLHQTINCKISKLNYNLNIIIPNLITFSRENDLKLNGKPFVIYNSYDVKNGFTNVSVCVPIKNRIYTSSGSDINCTELKPFSAFKTTLIGDYSHRDLAWKKATDYLLKDKQIQNKSIPILEIFTKGSSEVKRPSKFETTIYIAIQSNYITKVPAIKSIDENIEASEIVPQQ
jgi:hypothetical protein